MCPETDAYVQRRYTDLAVTIHADIQQSKGLYNHYSPWLEGHLQNLSAKARGDGSLMNTPSPVDYTPQGNTWIQSQTGIIGSGYNRVDNSDVGPSSSRAIVDACMTKGGVKNAWGNEYLSTSPCSQGTTGMDHGTRPVVTERGTHTSKLCTIL